MEQELELAARINRAAKRINESAERMEKQNDDLREFDRKSRIVTWWMVAILAVAGFRIIYYLTTRP